jgi:ribosomal silencing factor RsfS
MATLKQFEANRRNAQKSTGPKTPDGKAAVSMNALRHGLRARTVVLPGEDREEFDHLCDDLEVEWHPQSRTEQFYVEQMAVSQWKLTRMEVVEVNIFKEADTKTQVPMLDRLWQAEHRLERSYVRAQRELQRLQDSRPHPIQQPEDPTPAPAAEAPSTAAAEVGQAVSPVGSTPCVEPPSEVQPGHSESAPRRLNPNPPPCNNTIPPRTEV